MNLRKFNDLKKEGKKIAFIKGNRNVSTKNVDSKKKSLNEFGMNLVPLMVVDGKRVINDGCTLINPVTLEDIPNETADQYVAVLEGQNRYVAAFKMGFDMDNLYCYDCYCQDKSVKDILAEVNIESIPYNSQDFIGSALLFQPDNKLAQFAKELSDNKYPISTINKILFFNDKDKFTKEDFAKIMKGQPIKGEYDLERAERFLNAARSKFVENFISKRYLINAVIRSITAKGADAAIEAIKNFNQGVVKKIYEAKYGDKENIIRSVLKELLNN